MAALELMPTNRWLFQFFTDRCRKRPKVEQVLFANQLEKLAETIPPLRPLIAAAEIYGRNGERTAKLRLLHRLIQEVPDDEEAYIELIKDAYPHRDGATALLTAICCLARVRHQHLEVLEYVRAAVRDGARLDQFMQVASLSSAISHAVTEDDIAQAVEQHATARLTQALAENALGSTAPLAVAWLLTATELDNAPQRALQLAMKLLALRPTIYSRYLAGAAALACGSADVAERFLRLVLDQRCVQDHDTSLALYALAKLHVGDLEAAVRTANRLQQEASQMPAHLLPSVGRVYDALADFEAQRLKLWRAWHWLTLRSKLALPTRSPTLRWCKLLWIALRSYLGYRTPPNPQAPPPVPTP
jgi:tetratricopeptide (TPR) repeat protein